MSDHKIVNKRVGEVEIFEFYGSLTERQASASRQAVLQRIEDVQGRCALFNLRGLRKLDEKGTESLTSGGRNLGKCALLYPDLLIRERNGRTFGGSNFHLVEDETEAAYCLAREFAAVKEEENPPRVLERRRFERLASVLPLHATLKLELGKKIPFFTVVTNLSEGGLYAEFIDSESEEKGREFLNPEDSQLLELKLHLTSHDVMFLKGRLIHKNRWGGGVGIEFFDIEDAERDQIVDWLFQLRLTQ